MDPISRLVELFKEFPGIGPRQARRFAYFLLTRDESYLSELVRLVGAMKSATTVCSECCRFFSRDSHHAQDGAHNDGQDDRRNSTRAPLCNICRDDHRDRSMLMLVSRDVDLETIERSHSYNGMYFVLGGVVPILEKNPELKIRLRELHAKIARSNSISGPNPNSNTAAALLREIILSMNATADGENTADYLRGVLKSLVPKSVRITILGRGLSTGTELEYSDSDTIVHALKNRA